MTTIERSSFPNDDDGEVLFQLASKGINLSQKQSIEFSCFASTVQSAERIADDLRSYGYEPSVYVDDGPDGDGSISVYLGIEMLLDHSLLLIEQDRLNTILSFHGTSCDGWQQGLDE